VAPTRDGNEVNEVSGVSDYRRGYRLPEPLALLTNQPGAQPIGVIATDDAQILDWCSMDGSGACIGAPNSLRLLKEWFEPAGP
jgi:hypothetical protein